MRASALWAALMAMAAACDSGGDPINPDRCFILVAQVAPVGPVLEIGDTVTMHATFTPSTKTCWPADTSAAALRWISSDSGAIAADPLSGRLTARRAGWSQIILTTAASGGGVLGTTFASVLEPAGADSLISIVRNATTDSATVTLRDANGGLLRTVTLGASSGTCWNTPLPDSAQYSAEVYLPGSSVATPIGTKWVVHRALGSTHTWLVNIDPQSSGLPTLDLAGVQPDQGC